MKKYLCILIMLFFTGIAAFAQNATISSTRSNIKHGITATYTTTGGLVLSFNQIPMDASDKRGLATGFFVSEADITLTNPECKALKVSNGFKILKGRWPIKRVNGIDTCKPGFRKSDEDAKLKELSNN